ncbi:hypothetical protein SCLCIDRAFT_21898 [Scleroderma citrinum Foug A]|uniref:Uncharacterized protein n=1 Tax=Scleroderma citrinum Foug A TaxID=1036808 RepID=A0A0C3E0R4_9AGAM|nr:hypothetical protein SCLCIDRAFT_21898 [Scleroderma citrinum Foug A]
MDDSSASEESGDRSKGEDDDELADKMEEYRYSGLDQVLENKEDGKVSCGEDAPSREDGENLDDGLEYAGL